MSLPKAIFISYRRDDSGYVADMIRGYLLEHVADIQIFMDVDDIPLGSDFRTSIQDSVQQCSALLAIIGNDWAGSGAPNTSARIHDPADFVRIEIEAALRRGIPVIPVLVREATLPQPKQLPESLQSLSFRQAAEVRAGPHLKLHLGDLARRLKDLATTTPRATTPPPELEAAARPSSNLSKPPPPATPPIDSVKRKGIFILLAAGAIISFALAMIYHQYGRSSNPQTKLTEPTSQPQPTAASNSSANAPKALQAASAAAPTAAASTPPTAIKVMQKPFIRMAGSCTRDSADPEKYHLRVTGTARLPAGGRFRVFIMGGQQGKLVGLQLLCSQWQYTPNEIGCFRAPGEAEEGRWQADFELKNPSFNSGNHLVVPGLIFASRTGPNYIGESNSTTKCPE